MSKENVISKKEPFCTYGEERPYQCGKAWAIRLIAVALSLVVAVTCDRGSHKTESDRSISWNY